MKAKLLFSFIFIFTFFTIKAQNLVAYYPFNGNANDESANTNHGTVNGATLTTDRFGNANSAYYFDGVDDFISCIKPGPTGILPRTISFWAKTNIVPLNHSNVVLSYGGVSTSTGYGDRIEVSINTNSKRGPVLSIGGSILVRELDNSDNDWHFYTIVFEGGTNKHLADFKLYGDGQLLTNTTVLIGNSYTVNTEETPIFIGYLPSIGRYFNGYIDEIKIYNIALTPEEIKNEYRNLIAYYPFNGNANDESGYTNHGTINGATLTTDRFGNTNSAFEFDGIDDFIQVANSNSLNIFNSDLTISMWLFNYSDSKFTYKGISKGGYDTGAGYELVFNNDYSSDGELQFNISKSARRVPSINTYNNQWVMLTATYTHATETRKTYINGVEKSFTIFNEAILKSSTSDLYIGKRAPGNNYIGFVNGKMDDIRIYNSALTATEILNLYNLNTLKIEKFDNVTESPFYVNNNTLYFKKAQNLQEIEAIEVYNSIGQKMLKTSNIKNEISFKTLPIGVYILRVKNFNSNIQTLRFLIN